MPTTIILDDPLWRPRPGLRVPTFAGYSHHSTMHDLGTAATLVAMAATFCRWNSRGRPQRLLNSFAQLWTPHVNRIEACGAVGKEA
jgi:hypothetical protein